MVCNIPVVWLKVTAVALAIAFEKMQASLVNGAVFLQVDLQIY